MAILTLFLARTDAFAAHDSSGTSLWGYQASFSNAQIGEYDMGNHTFSSSCTPEGGLVPPNANGNGRGVAFDPIDGKLWYTVLNQAIFTGDGLIHKATLPLDCTEVSSIPFGDGPGGTIQDSIGAIDIDPDDGHIWAAGYQPIEDWSFLYKVDRATGAILQSCSVPFGGGGVGNDTLTVAKLSGLSGSGKYLLSDAGELNTPNNGDSLLVVDEATCVDGGAGAIVASPPKVIPMTGIDYENGRLVATDLNTIYDLGGFPFDTIRSQMPASPVSGLEDISLETASIVGDTDRDGIHDDVDGMFLNFGVTNSFADNDNPNVGQINGVIDQSTVFSSNFTDRNVPVEDKKGQTNGTIWDGVTASRNPLFAQAHTDHFCQDGSDPKDCFDRNGISSDPGDTAIDSIVIHFCTGTTFSNNCVNWFRTPVINRTPQVIGGTHYTISKKGEVVQMVTDKDKAFHATYYNDRSIGIELEGSGGEEEFTFAMYESLASLIVKLLAKHPNIPSDHPEALATPPEGETDPSLDENGCLNVAGIVGHDQVQPGLRHFDFADYFDFAETCGFARITADGERRISTKDDPGDHFSWTLLMNLVEARVDDLDNGPVLTVKDAVDPAKGVLVEATGGGGRVAEVITACDGGPIVDGTLVTNGVVFFTDGDSAVLTCGSLTVEVLRGPVEIGLSDTIVVSVPDGTTAAITQVSEGEFEIANPVDSEGTIVVHFHGRELLIGPGKTLTPASIDIKPGSDPNSINCNNVRGVIPVAILTAEEFDATGVDHTSVIFDGAVETHIDPTGEPRRHEEDADGDGDTDLVFHFLLGDSNLTCDSTAGVLTGRTFDGNLVVGSDLIRMVSGGGNQP